MYEFQQFFWHPEEEELFYRNNQPIITRVGRPKFIPGVQAGFQTVQIDSSLPWTWIYPSRPQLNSEPLQNIFYFKSPMSYRGPWKYVEAWLTGLSHLDCHGWTTNRHKESCKKLKDLRGIDHQAKWHTRRKKIMSILQSLKINLITNSN